MNGIDKTVRIRFATGDDCSTILGFIRELAEFERLAHEVTADEARLRATLFPAPPGRPAGEVLVIEADARPVGFALFFTTYSTFLARPGLYLEDLYVQPASRSAGIGGMVMATLARITVDRGYGRFEWSVLDWNERALAFYHRLGAVAMSDWTVQRLTGAALDALATRGSRL